jgi:hypothetical protein
MFNLVILLLSLILPFAVLSETITLKEIKTLAVAKPLEFKNGKPVTLIDTGPITDPAGNLARGPHLFEIGIDPNAPYPVFVKGKKINPGEKHFFVENLSQTSHGFSTQIYPAISGVEGVVNFTLKIPEVLINACPENFTERTDNCYRAQYKMVVYDCPLGTELNNITKNCERHETVPSHEYCVSPYQLRAGKCTHEFTVPAEQTCPLGDNWSDNGTECKFYDVQPINSCKSGFIQDANNCFPLTPLLEDCPEGYSIKSGRCELFISDEAKSCSEGYVKLEGLCYQLSEAEQICPTGFNILDESCKKTTTTPKGQSCPEGYSKFGEVDKCFSNEGATPTKKCDEGVLQGGNCVINEVIQASIVCPSWAYESNGQCAYDSSSQPRYDCPSRWVFDSNGTTCYERENYVPDPNHVCPSGYTKHKWRTNRCTDSRAYIVAGRSGPVTQEMREQCTSSGGRVEWDGVHTVCLFMSPASIGFSYTCMAPNFEINGRATCTNGNTQPPVAICDEGYLSGGLCHTYTYTSPSSYYCPAGYELSGHLCSRQDSYPAIEYCADKELKEGLCRDVGQLVEIKACPDGFFENPNGQCVGSESVPVKTMCQGTVYDRTSGICYGTPYKKYTGEGSGHCGGSPGGGYSAIVEPGGCLWENKSTGDTHQGFFYVNCRVGHWESSDRVGYCSVWVTPEYEGERFCPDGMLMNGDICFVTAEFEIVDECPDSFTLDPLLDICTKDEIIDIEYKCQPQFAIFDTVFCKSLDADYAAGECSSSLDININNGRCERFDFNPIQYSCQSGFVNYSGSECRGLTADNTGGVCLDNYTLNLAINACEKTDAKNYDYICTGQVGAVNNQFNGVNCDVKYEHQSLRKCSTDYQEYILSDDGLSCSGISYVDAALKCDVDAGFTYDANTDQCKKIEIRPFLQDYSQYLEH